MSRNVHAPSFDLNRLLSGIEALSLALVLLAAVSAIVFALYADSFLRSCRLVGAAAAVFLAAGGIGAVLGFLFAVPRVARDTVQAVVASSAKPEAVEGQRRRLATNTNLEEVSDWLTKMVVGIGLVQLREIEPGLGRFGGAFAAAFPDVPGVGLFFSFFATAALLIAFLFFYVETRTRGTVMFGVVERFGVDEDFTSAWTARQFEVSPFEPVWTRDGKTDGETAIQARTPADRAILSVDPGRLASADEFAAWASAKARIGDLVAAAAGWLEAIKRDRVGRPEFPAKLAEVLAAQDRPRDAMAALREAIAKSPPNSSEQLKYKVEALLNALYIAPPQSFITAQPLYEELIASPQYARDPWIRVWAAAALGQKALWLKQTRGAAADLSDVRRQVLEQIRALKEIAPAPDAPTRVTLRRLIEPSADSRAAGEDDLVVFRDDPEIYKAISE